MCQIGDLVKIENDYRLYLVVEANDNKTCSVRYIHGNPLTCPSFVVVEDKITFIDHINIKTQA